MMWIDWLFVMSELAWMVVAAVCFGIARLWQDGFYKMKAERDALRARLAEPPRDAHGDSHGGTQHDPVPARAEGQGRGHGRV